MTERCATTATPATSSDDCRAGACVGTPLDRAAFRLSEVHGGADDWIEIVNGTSCTLDPGGLELRFRLGCDSAEAVTLPSRAVAPGGVLRLVDDAILPNEIELRTLCHATDEGAWVALCDGPCASTCGNFIDYFEQTGLSPPTGEPVCASFIPTPLDTFSAGSTESALRVAFTGSGAAGREADWRVGPMTRTP